MMKKIFAIDQATQTGYAIIDETGMTLESGSVSMSDRKRTGESRGMRYIRFEKFLNDVYSHHPEITLICHEQTLLRGGSATEIANGLKALILKFAIERGLESTCVHTSELKKFATGNGRAEKQDMMTYAGYADRIEGKRLCVDDNEADAICIGMWAFVEIWGGIDALAEYRQKPEKKVKKKKTVTRAKKLNQ